MSFLVVLFYLLVWSCGLVNLFILTVLFSRDRERLYLHELLLMASFTTLLVMQSLNLIIGSQIESSILLMLTLVFAAVGQSLLIYALPAYVNLLAKIERHGIIDKAFLGLAAVVLVFRLIMDFGIGSGEGGWLHFYATLAAMVYSLGMAVHGMVMMFQKGVQPSADQENNETIRLAIRMGVVTLATLPFLVCYDLLYVPFPVLKWRLPDGLHVTPFIFLMWSVQMLGLRTRSLMTRPVAMGNQPLRAGPVFHERYGISPREQEVVDFLIQGLSYEELADRLCISLSTAKTHINRIYRKTGVNSKVELIHCLQHHNQPKS